jgi:hypothetical protein
MINPTVSLAAEPLRNRYVAAALVMSARYSASIWQFCSFQAAADIVAYAAFARPAGKTPDITVKPSIRFTRSHQRRMAG